MSKLSSFLQYPDVVFSVTVSTRKCKPLYIRCASKYSFCVFVGVGTMVLFVNILFAICLCCHSIVWEFDIDLVASEHLSWSFDMSLVQTHCNQKYTNQ